MKNILKTINVLAVILLLASCSEAYLDVNEDPNNPLTVSPDLMLPVALNYSAFDQERNRGQNTLGNMLMYNWSQSDGFSWYTTEFQYLVTTSFYQQNFNTPFGNTLKQYQSIAEVEGAENGYYHAIAMIMKAYTFQILVDQYGDIPYFEALQRGGNATPAYDDAQTIYEDLIVQLTAAIDLIDATDALDNAVQPGADDGMYGGNMDDWKRFANSVKLRILVRQSDMSGRSGYIQSELAAIAAEGSGFVTDDVRNNIGYAQITNQQNPKWNALGQDVGGTNTLNNDATCATPFVLDYLTNTNDGRLDYIYEKPGTGHLGVIQGLLNYDETPLGVDGLVPDKVSNIGPGILKGPDQDAIMMTLAEVYFNQAEAVLKGLMSGDDEALYNAGVRASFSYLGAGSADAYLAQTLQLVKYSVSNNKLEAIITQKWIATNGIDAIQSWFDYSRTGYPSNLPISVLAPHADRPVRLFYPSSEITTNGLNVPTQPDAFSAKIFWAN